MIQSGLSSKTINKINDVFKKHTQIIKVMLYGSRATGTYKKGSDIDLTMLGNDLTYQLQMDVANELDDLFLPYMIDLSIFDSLANDRLKEHIERVGVVFYEREKALKPEWEVKKLGEVCEFGNGLWTGKKPPFQKVGVVRNTNFTKDCKFNDLDIVFLEVEQSQFAKRKLQYGDLILEKSGGGPKQPVGRVIIFDKKQGDYSFSNFTSLIRIKNQSILNFNFLYKYLFFSYVSGATEQMQSHSTGIRNLKFDEYKSIELPIPPLPEQQRIVSILDKAFSAIEQAKSNAEKNLKNAKELFDSYLQNIDAKMVALSDLVNITTGKLNSNEAVEDGKYPFFTCSREVFSINKYAFDLEAILLAGNNASGDFNVKHYKGKFNAYQRTYIITVNEKLNVLHRYLYFQLLNSLKEFKNQSVGSNTRFLKIGMIYNLQIPLPSIKEQNQIINTLDSLLSKTQQLEAIYQHKLTKLEELKKSILQKAFNGELN